MIDLPKPQGRPRDDTTGPALLEAARRLVIRDGYRSVSIHEIAEAAGVAKQTLYRRWPSKAALVLDAFLASAGHVPVSHGRPVGEALPRYLRALFRNLESDGPAIRSLIAASQDDPDFLAAFRERFVKPRAQIVAELLRAAGRNGELAPASDLDMAVDALHGAFWYRLLQGERLDAKLADRLAAFILKALA